MGCLAEKDDVASFPHHCVTSFFPPECVYADTSYTPHPSTSQQFPAVLCAWSSAAVTVTSGGEGSEAVHTGAAISTTWSARARRCQHQDGLSARRTMALRSACIAIAE